MDAAARLAQRARPLSRPNPGVAAIIVRDECVIARGWTRPGGRPHAEAVALEQIDGDAPGSTVYVTLEPCAHASERGPCCAGLLVEAAPARVVIGIEDPDQRTAGSGIAKLRQAGIAVDVLDHAGARQSLSGYLAQARNGRPFVTLKLALSQDGFIARPAGHEQWITGAEARAHVHAHRAQQDAILVGMGTWSADAPSLDVRLPGLEGRSPARLVLTHGEAPEGTVALASPHAITGLEGVQYLYVEGGAETAEAFLEADLVDRIELYRAPVTVSDGLHAPAAIAELAPEWRVVEECQLGSDRFTAYSRES